MVRGKGGIMGDQDGKESGEEEIGERESCEGLGECLR